MELESDAALPLSFTVTNKPIPTRLKVAGGATFAYLYMSTDKTRDRDWGHLVVTIANSGTMPVAITSASVLKISFPKDLLTLDELRQVTLEPEFEASWSLTAVESEDSNGVLVLLLVGAERLLVTKGAPVEFRLQGVLSSANLWLARRVTFFWTDFTDIRNNSQGFSITREFLPRQADARIQCDWLPREEYRNERDTVYVTPPRTAAGFPGIENRLVLRVSQSEPAPIMGKSARIIVSFTTTATGDNNTALCTEDQLGAMTCRCSEYGGLPWEITKETDGKTMLWVLKAPQENVFGGSPFVTFQFDRIMTGTAREASSPVLVQWRGMTGFNAGYAMRPVTKTKATPYVRSFTATVGGQALDPERAVSFKENVTFQWDTFAADGCVFRGVDAYLPWKGERTVEPTHSSFDYELTPQITQDGSVETGGLRRIRVKVNDPVIVKTVSTADLWMQPAGVELSWECAGGDCVIQASGVGPVPVPPVGSQVFPAIEGAYEMVCQGTTTRRQSFPARTSPPSCTLKVEWLGGDMTRWIWTSINATDATLSIFDNSFPQQKEMHRITGRLSGTVDLNTKGAEGSKLTVTGLHGTCIFSFRVASGKTVLPEFRLREEKLGTNGDYRISWELIGARSCALAAISPAGVWSSTKLKDAVQKNYRTGTPRYFFTARSMNMEANNCIYDVTPGGRALELGEGDAAEEIKRILDDPSLTEEEMLQRLSNFMP